MYGAYRWMSRIGNAADCKFVASALGVQVPLHLLYACISPNLVRQEIANL